MNQAANAFDDLSNKLIQASQTLVGTTTSKFVDGTSIQQLDLDQVEKLLCEVKGLQQRIATPDSSTPLQQPASEIAASEGVTDYHLVR